LPANTTHILQPLDAEPFGAYKKGAHKAIDSALLHGEVVTNMDRIALLAPAWRNAMKPGNIIDAFKLSGVWPPRGFPGHSEPSDAPLPPAEHSQSMSQTVLKLEQPEEVYTKEGMLRIANLLKIPDGHERVWVFPKHAEAKQPKKGKDQGFARILSAPALKSVIEDPDVRKEERATLKADVAAAQQGTESKKRRREADAAESPVENSQEVKQSDASEPAQPRPKRARRSTSAASGGEGGSERVTLEELHKGVFDCIHHSSGFGVLQGTI
jgi:hypothetical protein